MKHIFHRYKKAWYTLNDIQEIGKIVNARMLTFVVINWKTLAT